MPNRIRQSYLGTKGFLITVVIMVGFTAYLEKSCVARAKQDSNTGVNDYE